ncbi:MAG: LysR family transcriptional regulator [Anaeromyxobacter sp.]
MPKPAPLLDDMLLLTEVVAAGGVSAAAGPLGLRKSSVSRRLTALEERLGTRLLERGARGVRLTEAGRAYHAEAARLVAEARRAEEAARAASGVAQGTLRVAAPALLGELVAPLLAELLARHPRLQLELAPDPGPAALGAGKLDLLFHAGPLADSALRARRLGSLRTGCYASPAYLARRGTPRAVEELASHDAVLVTAPGSDEVWFFAAGGALRVARPAGRLRLPDLRSGLAAARAGAGLVRLPASLAAADLAAGALRPVLAEATPPGVPIWAVFAGGREPAPKVRALLALLTAPGAAVPWEREPPAARR